MAGSKFLGAAITLDPTQAATLTLGVSLVKGLLNACTTGNLSGFTETANVAADMVEQAIEHPQKYNSPYRVFRP